jgi:hypothetical protein
LAFADGGVVVPGSNLGNLRNRVDPRLALRIMVAVVAAL